MSSVLSVDLAYKKYEGFGFCLLTVSETGTLTVAFPTANEVGLEDPPNPSALSEALLGFCGKHEVRILLLDGPQGWKNPDSKLPHSRQCERSLNTPAKTGALGQVKPKNYLPFVQFSIQVFQNLLQHAGASLANNSSIRCPRNDELLLLESFPYSAWRQLCLLPLPSKQRCVNEDIEKRSWILQNLYDFTLSARPTHDELQALVAGLAGPAILAQESKGYVATGQPPDTMDDTVYEGFIVSPNLPAKVSSPR